MKNQKVGMLFHFEWIQQIEIQYRQLKFETSLQKSISLVTDESTFSSINPVMWFWRYKLKAILQKQDDHIRNADSASSEVLL
jgi:hypothetical protein